MHPENFPSISSLCFGVLYPEKLMPLVFVCPYADSARSQSSVFVDFRSRFDAYQRRTAFQSAFLVSSSIQKTIRPLPSHSPIKRLPHSCPANFWGKPARCSGPNDWAKKVSNDVTPSNFGGFKMCFALVTAVVFVWRSSSDNDEVVVVPS